MATNTIEQLRVLDYTGTQQLAATIFAYVESTYVRRSVYESDMAALVSRLDAIDAYNRYTFEVNQTTGELSLSVPDDASVDITINQEGYLILTSNDSNIDQALTHYSFSQDSDGTLYLTID